MSDSEKKETGFSSCYYLKFNIFAPIGNNFYCKKKQTYDFSCEKCPYKKLEIGK